MGIYIYGMESNPEVISKGWSNLFVVLMVYEREMDLAPEWLEGGESPVDQFGWYALWSWSIPAA